MATFTFTPGPDYFDDHSTQIGSDSSNTWLLGRGEDHLGLGNYDSWQENIVDGGWGADNIIIRAGYEAVGKAVVNGGDGSDYIETGYGDDTIHGGNGNDQLYATYGYNIVYGEQGNDDISGSGFLAGGTGHDTMYGEENSVLRGGEGNDHLTVTRARSTSAGDGDDLVDYSGWYTNSEIALGRGIDTLHLGYNDYTSGGNRVALLDYKAEDHLTLTADLDEVRYYHKQILNILDTNDDRVLNGKDASVGEHGWGVQHEGTDLVLDIMGTDVVFHNIKAATFDFLS